MGTTRTIKTRIQLRRDSESNFASIKDTFIPLKGEVILVDTESNGLRIKIGNGIDTFSVLPYTDIELRGLINQVITFGYYYENNFYVDIEHTEKYVPYENRIYMDRSTIRMYIYLSDEKKYRQIGEIPTASSTNYGILKLYEDMGTNTDGTMTQNAITTELNKKFIVKVEDDESIVFNN